MSKLLPESVIDVYRSFNDIIIDLIGVSCDLYIPNNLTSLESNDAYTSPKDITYNKYINQVVWVTWFEKNVYRLKKLGMFVEGEVPILARFKNTPVITLQSYIQDPIRYIPNSISGNGTNEIVDSFEIVDIAMSNTYADEIYRYCKLAPLRRKARNA